MGRGAGMLPLLLLATAMMAVVGGEDIAQFPQIVVPHESTEWLSDSRERTNDGELGSGEPDSSWTPMAWPAEYSGGGAAWDEESIQVVPLWTDRPSSVSRYEDEEGVNTASPSLTSQAASTANTRDNRPDVVCKEDEILCDQWRCVPHALRCDGVSQCNDGSDETACDAIRSQAATSRHSSTKSQDRVSHDRNPLSTNPLKDPTKSYVESDTKTDTDKHWRSETDKQIVSTSQSESSSSDMHAHTRTHTSRQVHKLLHHLEINKQLNGTTAGESSASIMHEKRTDEDRDSQPGRCGGDDISSCDNGVIICRVQKCDGHVDCSDGSDEVNCSEPISHTPACPIGHFVCDQLRCVSFAHRCDGHIDCDDLSDEQNCSASYECEHRGEFSCSPHGLCIPLSRRCNGVDDCPGANDEVGCHDISLEEDSKHVLLKTYPDSQTVVEGEDVVFRCRDEGDQRVRVYWARVARDNLPSRASDIRGRLTINNAQLSESGQYVCLPKVSLGMNPHELVPHQRVVNLLVLPRLYRPSFLSTPPTTERLKELPSLALQACQSIQATCSDGSCISRSDVCNGVDDCPDGSDEVSCSGRHRCEPNEWSCAFNSTKCVLKDWLCDGDDDCDHGEDEQQCDEDTPNGQCSSKEFQCEIGSDSGPQCVPRSFHCDGHPDCQDMSDEVGCTAPVFSSDMVVHLHVTPGDTFVLHCRAVGVPTPQVIWRLNWGHVPDKCQQSSSGGEGTLTCDNAALSDQGAYSCEAMNIKGSRFAVPDTLVVVSDTAATSVCRAGDFNSAAVDIDDCQRCFCFGATNDCHSSPLFVSTLPYVHPGELRLASVVRVTPEVQVLPDTHSLSRLINAAGRSEAVVASSSSSDSVAQGQLYFALPYSGPQLFSYGGYLRYTLEPPFEATRSIFPDVLLKGGGRSVWYRSDVRQRAPIRLKIVEGTFYRSDSDNKEVAASREDIMMVLHNVDLFLIAVPRSSDGFYGSLKDVQLDSATASHTVQGAASLVEQCNCPLGYSGLSCEDCAAGYERRTTGQYLGRCVELVSTCQQGFFGDPARNIACRKCPCYMLDERFGQTCRLDYDDHVTCDCPPTQMGRRCERCAPGYTGDPRSGQPCVPESQCDLAGSTQQDPDPETGHCQCKLLVTGLQCDRCMPRAFFLHENNRHGCINCFCMGVSDRCSSSNYYRHQVSSVFTHSDLGFSLSTGPDGETVPGTRVSEPLRLVNKDFHHYSGGQPLYWSLPEPYLGNKVSSYGGDLSAEMVRQQDGAHHLQPLEKQDIDIAAFATSPAADVILVGNGIRLHHTSRSAGSSDVTAGGLVRVSVPLLELEWRHEDGRAAERYHLLMALAGLRYVGLRATEQAVVAAARASQQHAISLSNVSLDIAVPHNTGQSPAPSVEQCECPIGYTGLSCEQCDVGYTRSSTGRYLGHCQPCNCHSHSELCHPETGHCRDCRDNTAGSDCGVCLPGYMGDPRSGQPCVPEATRPCLCDPRGSVNTSCDLQGRCHCKVGVEGDDCGRCRAGYFSLSMDHSAAGCLRCYCSLVSSQCGESHYHRTQIPMQLINRDHGFSLVNRRRTHVIDDNVFSLDIGDNEIGFNQFSKQETFNYDNMLFWSLPPEFLGNQLASYGGKLMLRQRYTSRQSSRHIDDFDVIVHGASGQAVILAWKNPLQLSPDRMNTYEVEFSESAGWMVVDDEGGVREAASRAHLMSVLSRVEAVLVRAVPTSYPQATYLSNVVLDTATALESHQGLVRGVEQCICPEGYSGLSCETCAAGYYRSTRSLTPLCRPCPCNGNEHSCYQHGDRVICRCRASYFGHDCQKRAHSATNSTASLDELSVKLRVVGVESAIWRESPAPSWLLVIVHCSCLPGRYSDLRIHIQPRLQTDTNTRWRLLAQDDTCSRTLQLLVKNDQKSRVPAVHCWLLDQDDSTMASVLLRASQLPSVRVSDAAAVTTDGPLSVSDNIVASIMGDITTSTGMQKELDMADEVTLYDRGRATLHSTIFDSIFRDDDSTETTAQYVHQDFASATFSSVTEYEETIKQRTEPSNAVLWKQYLLWQKSDGEDITTELPLDFTEQHEVVNTVGPYGYDSESISSSKRSDDFKQQETSTMTSLLVGSFIDEELIKSGQLAGADISTDTSVTEDSTSSPAQETLLASHDEPTDGEDSTISVSVRDPVIEVLAGDSATFHCSGESRIGEQVTIKWRRQDAVLPPDRAHQPDDDGATLVIRRVIADDSGVYVCEVRDSTSTRTSRTVLRVGTATKPGMDDTDAQSLPPIVTISPAYVEVAPGQQVRLVCEVNDRTAQLTWTRSNGPLLSDTLVDGSVLTIASATSRHQDDYTCRGSSAGGVDYATALVRVARPVDTSGNRLKQASHVQARVGSRVQLRCPLQGPLQHAVWQKQHAVLSHRARQFGSQLVIDNVQLDDQGTYDCRVVSPDGERLAETVILTAVREVNDLPPTITIRPASVLVPQGGSVRLDCIVTGAPGGSVTWRRSHGVMSPRARVEATSLHLSRVQMTDRGHYMCHAQNEFASTRAFATVDVEPRESPVIELSPVGEASVEQSGSLELHCRIIQGQPEPRVVWSRQHNHQLPPSAHQLDHGVLRLERVERTDSGVYVCTAQNEVGSQVQRVRVTVRFPPVLSLSHTSPLRVMSGERVNVDCSADGEPTPSVEWKRHNNGQFSPLDVSSFGSSRLLIDRVQPHHTGVYVCEASNGVGRDRQQLKLLVLPVQPTQSFTEQYRVPRGGNAELRCFFRDQRGTPVAVTWRRGDDLPLPSNHVIASGTLYLYDVDKSDQGIYTCQARDYTPYGPAVSSAIDAHLLVIEPPRVQLRPRRQVVRPGDHVTIQCTASGDPPVNVSWSRVGLPLPVTVHATDGRLHFRGISPSDAGQYVCVARNAVAHAEGIAEVVVHDAPSITAVDSDVTAAAGAAVSLRCRVTPSVDATTADIQWRRRDGAAMSPRAVIYGQTLSIGGVSEADSGSYVCETRTVDGDVLRDRVLLHVTPSSPPTVAIYALRRPVREGDDLLLRCDVTATDNHAAVTWSRADGVPLSSRVSIDGERHTLFISAVRASDQATYQCSVNSSTDSHSSSYVLALSGLRRQNDIVEASIGSSATLICSRSLSESQLNDVTWRKTDAPSPRQLVNEAGRLHIDSVQASDAGSYECRAGADARAFTSFLVVTDLVPSFNQNVNDSYLQLASLPGVEVHMDMELSLRPQRDTGIVFFNGGTARADAPGDFILFGINKGVPEMRYSLDGRLVNIVRSRRHITPSQWYTFRLQRHGTEGRIWLDGEEVGSERGSGDHVRMTLNQPLFVGGVPDYNELPAQAGFNIGYSGCISQLAVAATQYNLHHSHTDDSSSDYTTTTAVTPAIVSSVGACDVCGRRQRHLCGQRDICVPAANTHGHRCLCAAHNGSCSKCDSVRCATGECVDTRDGAECVCPWGRAGRRCERQVLITEPLLNGSGFMAFNTDTVMSDVTLEVLVRPAGFSQDRLLFYLAESVRGLGDFVAVIVSRTAHVLLVFSTQSALTDTVSSRHALNVSEYTRISIRANSSYAQLQINDEEPIVAEPRRYRRYRTVPLQLRTALYVGGVDTRLVRLSPSLYSLLQPSSSSHTNSSHSVLAGFHGCIGRLTVVERSDIYLLRPTGGAAGVSQCSSSEPCDRHPCRHGAVCRSLGPGRQQYQCTCAPGFTGVDCEVPIDLCAAHNACWNGGLCVNSLAHGTECLCRLGFSGALCENTVSLGDSLAFDGRSYVELPRNLLPHSSSHDQESFEVHFSTERRDGLLVFHGQTPRDNGVLQADFIALAVREGRVELSYDLGSGVIRVTAPSRLVHDGVTHVVHVTRSGRAAQLTLDNVVSVNTTAPGYLTVLHTKGNIYIGGVPDFKQMTGSKFSSGLIGCVHQLYINSQPISLAAQALSALSVLPCSASREMHVQSRWRHDETVSGSSTVDEYNDYDTEFDDVDSGFSGDFPPSGL